MSRIKLAHGWQVYTLPTKLDPMEQVAAKPSFAPYRSAAEPRDTHEKVILAGNLACDAHDRLDAAAVLLHLHRRHIRWLHIIVAVQALVILGHFLSDMLLR